MSEQNKLYGGSKAVSKCYEPFANVDAANAAVSAFMAELYDLRLKHGLSDVLVTVRDSVIDDDDEIGTVMVHSHFGDSMNAEIMAAYTLGRVSEERQESVRKVMSTNAIRNPKRGK